MKKTALLPVAALLFCLTGCSTPAQPTPIGTPEPAPKVSGDTTIPVEDVNQKAEEAVMNAVGESTKVDCGTEPVPFNTHTMRCTIVQDGTSTVFGADVRITTNPDNTYRVDVKVDTQPQSEPAA